MANKVFRQTINTGVALASAGAIALTPVMITPQAQPMIDTPRVVTAEVMPAGFVQDLRLIADGARAAVEQSVDGLTRKAPDLWWTVHEHWPDADLLHWNYALVSDIFLAPIAPLIVGPLNDAIAEAVARNLPVLGDQIRQIPEFIEYAFVRLVGPLLSAIGGAGMAHSEIFYSMTTLRIEPFIEAIVRAPFHVIDGLLFGGYGDLGPILQGQEGTYIPAPGLLTPWGKPPRVRDIKTPNDIVPNDIVTTTLPDADANLVSLVTEPADDAAATDSSVIDPATAPIVESTVETAVEAISTESETAAETPETAESAAEGPVTGDTAAPEAEVDPETVGEDASTAAGTINPTKPAKVDPAAGIRQGIKDFRAGVHNTVKKLTGRGSSSHSDPKSDAESGPKSGSDNGGSAKSESSGSGDSQ
ncbi:hypothetical protein [Mycolicibacterium diernhoferi]|uniref:Uncharacterized protein n=1 Tax=Mycolicibacterium diernhoferi TaxID=1801 RepID=A0A1Q4HI16_9MYCO|nr:hypothetical protein [Mycolicibacterium diernhoferi]OJZ67125.1 hypothetical protein BRW64_07810 [Mycolicibacterium diernhoferi]OPE55649.1 hypothetical protein BV510_03930 [Mycolicibacterium diernhoferi]PEG53653.1 hypothetical protein CRI78_14905 [Mycolicibacterium diernhoferi]QYL23326.1 hypothetical protein K0O62_03000 [Mycolicibacterium diernhoferi]